MAAIIKRLLKATVNIWDPIWILLYRLRYKERKPIPPFKNRDRIGARHIKWFMHSGLIDYDVFKRAISTYASADLSELTILDFGAGCGRVLQFFADSSAKLYASDVDPSAMQYLKRAYPSIKCEVNNSLPPLNLPDNSLDIVYSFSVWTHLPIESQIVWLREMKRVLRPGGLLLISFLGFYGLKLLRESGNQNEEEWHSVSDEQLQKDGVLYKKYRIFEEGVELFSGITGDYGVAVHDPGYIEREWRAYFEVLAIEIRAFHEHQDLVVLRNIQIQ